MARPHFLEPFVSRVRASVVLALLAPALAAQSVQVSGRLAQPSSSDVIDYRVVLDGAAVVYRADQEVDGKYELYAAPTDGSAPAVRLNPPLAPGSVVAGHAVHVFGSGGRWDYDVSSTGWAVFTVFVATNDLNLFSRPANGFGPAVRLDGPLAGGASVNRFWVLPDGEHVLFEAALGGEALYRVPIDGRAPATLLTPAHDPSDVWISPDGALVAFTTPFPGQSRNQLWVVPSDGSAAPALRATSRPAVPLGFTGLSDLVFSDDGTHALFFDVFAYLDDLVSADLFAVPLDGSHAPTQLNQGLIGPYTRAFVFDGQSRVGFADGTDFVSCVLDGSQRAVLQPDGWTMDSGRGTPVLTPDGTTAVIQTQMGFQQRALHAVRLDGSQPPVPLFLGSAGAGVAVTDTTAVFAPISGLSRFHAVPLAGGTPILLNPAPYDLGAADFRVRPGADELLFRAQPDGVGTIELFAVPLDASALPRRLNGPLIPSGDVDHYTIAPGAEGVVYRADRRVNEAFELSGTRIDGGPVVHYNPPFAPGPVLGDVQSFAVSPDGERVLYRADQDADDAFRLCLARTDGRGEPRELTAGLEEASSVFTGFALAPDGARAVFLFASSPSSASGELYSIALDGPSAPVQLDDRGRVYAQALAVDAQSQRVVYLRQRTLFGTFYDLCSAPLDGSGFALTLTPPSGNVSAYELTPDGSAAIYLADHAVAGVVELHRVPLDGSAPAMRLGAALPASADVTAFALAPDGSRVAFLADVDADEVVELWSVPADGSGPATKLSGALVAGGDVTHLAITPDSAHVVHRADAVTDGTFDLFRVPLAGGSAVPLTVLPAGGGVQEDFVVSPDSAHVLFRADPAGASAFQLFRAPSDGSAAPVALSGPLVAGGAVVEFALAPDQSLVAYRADQHVDGVFELHVVPLSGGPSVRVQALPPTADVTHVRIAPDSATIAWRADADVNEAYDLFLAPLDGSAPPRRVSRPLPAGGDVQTDFRALAGGRCVYRADQEENDVLELYTGFLGHGPRRAATPTRSVTR